MQIVILAFLFLLFHSLHIYRSSEFEHSAGMTVYGLITLFVTLLTSFCFDRLRLEQELRANRAILIVGAYFAVLFFWSLAKWPDFRLTLVQFLLFIAFPLVAIIPVNFKFVRLFDHLLLLLGIFGGVAIVSFHAAGTFELNLYFSRFELAQSKAVLYFGFMVGLVYLTFKYAASLNYIFFLSFAIKSFASLLQVASGSRTAFLLYVVFLLSVGYIMIKEGRGFFVKIFLSVLFVLILLASSWYVFNFVDLNLVLMRVVRTFDNMSALGGIANDPRVLEFRLNSNVFYSVHILWGHGFGSYWLDHYGMYAKEQSGFRTLFHFGILHFVFKIGFIGTGLLFFMWLNKIKTVKGLIVRLPHAYWCFALFTFLSFLIYGPKKLSVGFLLQYFILFNPVLFTQVSRFKHISRRETVV